MAEQLPTATSLIKEAVPPAVTGYTGTLAPPAKKITLLDSVFVLGGNNIPLAGTANETLLAVQKGIQVGLHLAKEYSRLSGLNELAARNSAAQLGAREAEFTRLSTNAAAIAVFGAASYALWHLGKHREDEVRAVTVQSFPKAELSLVERVSALKTLSWHLAGVASQVSSELQLVKAFLQELDAVAKDIVARVPNLEGIATFETVAYQLVGTSFIVDGFEIASAGSGVSSEFRKVSLDAIVGNAEAKHAAKQTAYRLALYDPKLRKNPLTALGAMPFVRMGFGVPGTGKSMQIAGTATLIEDLCQRRGIPFVFAPMPNTVISTFQGGSAEKAEAWIRQHRNPGAIVYLVIDDGESNLEDRSRQGVSAGVREVIGVFLRETEGASAVPLGNSVIDIYTNLPEQLDPAVLSRVRERFELKGAQGVHDIADQMHLWWKGLKDLFPEELNGLTALDGYQLMSDQQLVFSGKKKTARYLEPQHEITKRALVAARKDARHPLMLVPALFAEFQQEVKGLSSRDFRNVTENAGIRFLDFDVPSTWFDNPTEFFDKSWDDRVGMLRELSRACCEGLQLHEVLLEEALRYLDVRAQIANLQFERDVKESVHRGKVYKAAEAILAAG
jgi:hypothetical protein